MGLLEMFGIGQRKKELISEAKQNGAIVIDVRSPEEYKSGHVKGSVNIPLNRLDSEIGKIKKMKQPLLLCCASGMRSGAATSKLKSLGVDCFNAGSWTSI
jgi:rhodanese-related sulfurtransferase